MRNKQPIRVPHHTAEKYGGGTLGRFDGGGPVGFIPFCLLVAAASSVALSVSAQLAVEKQIIVVSDDPAPGTEKDTTIFFFQSPVLDGAGNVAYTTQLAGPAIDDSNALITYYGLPGAWKTLRVGSPDPADPSLVLNAGGRPVVSQGGQFAVIGTLAGDGVDEFNQDVLYSGPIDGLTRLSRAGEPTPGAEGGTGFFTYFQGAARINDSGTIAFAAGLQGPDIVFENNQGLYLAAPGQPVQRLYRQNDPAEGFAGGRYFFAEAPLIAPTGQVSFSALVEVPNAVEPEAPADIAYAIYSKDAGVETSGGLRLIAKTGDVVPSYTDPTARLFLAIQPRINRSGNTYYTGYVVGDNTAFEDSFGVYVDVPGVATDRQLFRTGQPAPLAGSGVSLSGFGDSALNTNNILAFGAELTGAGITDINNTALYTYSDNPAFEANPWTLIAREGELAPGTDFYFGSLTFGSPSINAAGQVAFYTALIPDLNDPFTAVAALWLYDPTAGLTLIAKEGDMVEVSPGDFRQLASLTLDSFSLGTGLEDGRRSSFNDAGQLVYAGFFADDTAAIILATPTIPEPACAALLALPALAMRRRRATR